VLRERILATIARHRMVDIGQRLGVAVSGGADSVFLLHVLHELAPRWNLHLSAVHIDHGIRGAASKDDAEFVRALAASFGIPFHLHTADVSAAPENLEQAARRERHAFYRELISSGTLDRIATGHTRNDQAETVLYRILRGSGITGLAGILPVTNEGLIRPLLDVTRPEIEGWLREHRLSWRDDATNRDLSYARNRTRHETLPMLRAAFNPALDDALAQLAVLARDEEEYWEQIVRRQLGETRKGSPIILPISAVTTSPAMGRRILRGAIQCIKGDLRQIEFLHIERILEMVGRREGHDRVILPGADVMRSFDWIRIAPLGYDSHCKRDFNMPLEVPGHAELPGLPARITVRVRETAEAKLPYAKVVNELDWQHLRTLSTPNNVRPGLEVRNWRPGDQYCRSGQTDEQRLKLLFQEFRIPLWERRFWPIITYNGIIVWTRRFGVAAQYAAGPGTRFILQVEDEFSGEKSSPYTAL